MHKLRAVRSVCGEAAESVIWRGFNYTFSGRHRSAHSAEYLFMVYFDCIAFWLLLGFNFLDFVVVVWCFSNDETDDGAKLPARAGGGRAFQTVRTTR